MVIYFVFSWLSMEYRLRCMNCGETYPSAYAWQTCKKCDGILEVEYTGISSVQSLSKDFWSYEPLLPKGVYRHYELGNRTLLKADEDGLYLKLEIENPTRSFKDRGSVVEIAKAVEYGYTEVACASTGNMAYSIAYYSKLAGIESTIFVSRNANWLKVRDIRETRDANIIKVNGDFTEAQRRAIKYSKKKGAFLTGDYGYRKEGQKTMLFEIIAELPYVENIFIPIGNATLFSGLYKALTELKRYKLSNAHPRLIGVQALLTDPVGKAFRTGGPIEYQTPRTDAGAIAVGYPTYGKQAIEGIKATNGTVIEVSDGEMEKERQAFYRRYGLRVEMAGVASVAAYKKAGLKGKSVAIISGGNTLKP